MNTMDKLGVTLVILLTLLVSASAVDLENLEIISVSKCYGEYFGAQGSKWCPNATDTILISNAFYGVFKQCRQGWKCCQNKRWHKNDCMAEVNLYRPDFYEKILESCHQRTRCMPLQVPWTNGTVCNVQNTDYVKIQYACAVTDIFRNTLCTMASSAKVKELVYSYMQTQALVGAVKLNIFDTIQDIGGDVPIDILSQKVDVDSNTLERLLNVCVNNELLTKSSNSEGKVCLGLTPSSEVFLTSASDVNMLGVVDFISKIPWNQMGFVNVAKNGKGSEMQNNTSIKDFNKGETHKKWLDGFMKCMEGWARCGNHFFRDLDLSGYKTIMDLGGCLGTHARALKKQNPDSRVILADVAMVVESAKEKEENKGCDIEYQAVDFFDSTALPSADLVVMAHIIHDWSDSQSNTILTNVFNCINPGGKVMLLEKVLTEDKSGPFVAICTDVMMLSRSEGMERTFTEYTRLLEQCGFTDVELIPDKSDACYDVIFATKTDA